MSEQSDVLWHEHVSLAQWGWPPMNGVELIPGFTPAVIVLATSAWFVVDLPRETLMGLKKTSTRVFEHRITDITRVDVEGWSAERSEYGWRWTTGFLHAPTRVGATTGVTVFTAAGYAVFRLAGPPVTVKHRIDAFLRAVGMADAPTAPAAGQPLRPPAGPVVVGDGGIADQLAKLAQLRDQGVLTDAEFVAAKARLLG